MIMCIKKKNPVIITKDKTSKPLLFNTQETRSGFRTIMLVDAHLGSQLNFL